MTSARLSSLLLSVLLLALSSPAASSPAPAVVVVATGRTPALDAVAAEAETLARLKIRERAGAVVVNATAPQRTPEAVLADAKKLLEEGEGAYAELETKKAVRDLQGAVELLQADIDRTGDRELLLRALSLLGSVHNQSGQPEEAKRAFLALLALSPTYSLEEGKFPPSDVKLLQSLQEDLAFTEPGSLSLSSGDVPASVWLNGKFRGVTPLELSRVEPGTHTWLVRREGYLPRSGSVSVDGTASSGGRPGSVNAPLKPPPHDAELPSRIKRLVLEQMNLHTTLFALGDALGKPDEMVAVVVEEAPAGTVIKIVRAVIPGGVLVGYREVPGGEGWQARFDVALTDLLDAPTKAEILSPPVAAAPPAAEPPAAEEAEGDGTAWWIAGATGGLVLAGVLAGGAAIAIVSLGSGSEPTPSAAEDPHALARRRVVLGF